MGIRQSLRGGQHRPLRHSGNLDVRYATDKEETRRNNSWFVLVFVVGGAWNLWADEVRLNNGDRLMGKIQIVEGKLTVSGSLAGDVTVEMRDVQTFSTDAPVEIRLHDGTVVRQRVLAATGWVYYHRAQRSSWSTEICPGRCGRDRCADGAGAVAW